MTPKYTDSVATGVSISVENVRDIFLLPETRLLAVRKYGSVPITGMNVIDAFTKDASVAHES